MQRRKFLLPQLWGREPETQAWTGPRALPGLWGTVPLLLQLAATSPPPAAAFPRPLHASVCPSLPLGSVPPYSRKMSSQHPSSTISSPSGPSPRRGRAELPGGQIFGGHHPVLTVLIRTPRQPARGPRRSLSRTVRSPARCPPAPSADTTHSGFAPAAPRPFPPGPVLQLRSGHTATGCPAVPSWGDPAICRSAACAHRPRPHPPPGPRPPWHSPEDEDASAEVWPGPAGRACREPRLPPARCGPPAGRRCPAPEMPLKPDPAGPGWEPGRGDLLRFLAVSRSECGGQGQGTQLPRPSGL